eukprot:2862655-Prymnesium_polylepis.1
MSYARACACKHVRAGIGAGMRADIRAGMPGTWCWRVGSICVGFGGAVRGFPCLRDMEALENVPHRLAGVQRHAAIEADSHRLAIDVFLAPSSEANHRAPRDCDGYLLLQRAAERAPHARRIDRIEA